MAMATQGKAPCEPAADATASPLAAPAAASSSVAPAQPKFGPEPPPDDSAAEGFKGKGSSKGYPGAGKGKGKGKSKGFGDLPEGIDLVEILKEVEPGSWKRPKNFDEVEIHVIGTLGSAERGDDGSDAPELQETTVPPLVFLSTRERQGSKPLKFILGSDAAPVPGLNAAIATMRQGQTSRFEFAPEHAYGDQGRPGENNAQAVPPGSTVTFEIELLSWITRDDLFGDGKAVKVIIREGTGWQKPQAKDEVRISYKVTTTANGSVIVEFSKGMYAIAASDAKPHSLSLTLDKAICLMKREELARVTCIQGSVFEEAHGDVDVTIELHEILEVNDVSLKRDGSLMKMRMRQGEGHERPKDGQKVTLVVEAVTSGAEALVGDCPRTLEFISGNGDVCDALELVALDMQKQEQTRLTCTKPLHCNDKGLVIDLGIAARHERIPDKVVFDLQLVDFASTPDMYRLDEEEKLEFASNRKDAGAVLVKQKRWMLAIERYKKVIDLVNFVDGFALERRAKAREMKRLGELNKALCALRLEEWQIAKVSCDAVLKEDSSNVKALFRRGSALVALHDFPAAVIDLRRCLEIEPDNSEAKRMLQQALRGQKTEDKKCQGVYSKMCKGLGGLHPATFAEKDKENDKPNVTHAEHETAQGGVVKDDPLQPSEMEKKSLHDQLIEPGLRVRIEGLISRTELNGKEGNIVAWDTNERRWRVYLDIGQGICVKPSNLVVIPHQPSGQAVASPPRVKYGPPPPPPPELGG